MTNNSSVIFKSEDTALSHESETTLEHVISIMPQLIHWLIKAGVGYSEFTTALKPIFYNEAIKELDHIDHKKTDSAVSLLSGLNRRDVRNFCQTYGEYSLINQFNSQLPISVPARVIGLWVNQRLPSKIPFYGSEPSFEHLVKLVSSEKHPKSILVELIRLGIVQQEGEAVVLKSLSYTPDSNVDEIEQLFTQNISDHLSAGINNLKHNKDFLEQAVFADQLTQESVIKLNKLSSDLWGIMSKSILSAAIDYTKNDEGLPNANKRFRIGVYQYDE